MEKVSGIRTDRSCILGALCGSAVSLVFGSSRSRLRGHPYQSAVRGDAGLVGMNRASTRHATIAPTTESPAETR